MKFIPVFSGVLVIRSFVFYLVFYRSLFVLSSCFSFDHCIVCPPSRCELNSHPGEVYSIQHYVNKFVSDMSMFFQGTLVSSTNKTGRHHITEILLKVALNTITLTLGPHSIHGFWLPIWYLRTFLAIEK
jgi:hypothetical protein